MSNKRSDHVGAIVLFLVVVLLTFGIIQGIQLAVQYVNAKYVTQTAVQTAKTPDVDLAQFAAATITPAASLKQLILNKDYIATSDVASNQKSFRSESSHLILNGNFSQAVLHITGTVTAAGPHFLDIVYGRVAGTLFGVRISARNINSTLTQQNGGLFTSQSPIDLTIDLLNPVQLATTRGEFEKNGQGSKVVNLWTSNPLPPTYIPVLVAPYDANGNFGGARLSLSFEYSCEQDENCKGAICPVAKHIASCMKEEFGISAVNDWCRRAGYEVCSYRSKSNDGTD